MTLQFRLGSHDLGKTDSISALGDIAAVLHRPNGGSATLGLLEYPPGSPTGATPKMVESHRLRAASRGKTGRQATATILFVPTEKSVTYKVRM